MTTTRDLLTTVPQTGRLDAIALRTSRRGPVELTEATTAIVGVGLEGDRRSRRPPAPGSARQVTLIQAEHLDVVASLLGRDEVDPTLTRRNLVVRGINLRSLKGQRFRIGDAVLEGTGECHPCNRMEENLGPGGFQAMRGHGGLNARVVEGGALRVGDAVVPLGPVDDA